KGSKRSAPRNRRSCSRPTMRRAGADCEAPEGFATQRIERTAVALWGSFEMEQSVIQRTISGGILPIHHSGTNEVTLRNVVIDSACTAGGRCAAVNVVPFSRVTLENVVIRWSGDVGIRAGF